MLETFIVVSITRIVSINRYSLIEDKTLFYFALINILALLNTIICDLIYNNS